jgi:hypothetical protein
MERPERRISPVSQARIPVIIFEKGAFSGAVRSKKTEILRRP